MHCLSSDDPRYVQFGLEQVAQLDEIDSRFQEKYFFILEHSGRANCKLALQLLTSNSVDITAMHRELIARIGMNGGSSQLIIRYFENLTVVDPEVWVDMATRARDVSNYYDIFTVLLLLEERAGKSKEVRVHVKELLNSEDPNIVLRAEEFLNE